MKNLRFTDLSERLAPPSVVASVRDTRLSKISQAGGDLDMAVRMKAPHIFTAEQQVAPATTTTSTKPGHVVESLTRVRTAEAARAYVDEARANPTVQAPLQYDYDAAPSQPARPDDPYDWQHAAVARAQVSAALSNQTTPAGVSYTASNPWANVIPGAAFNTPTAQPQSPVAEQSVTDDFQLGYEEIGPVEPTTGGLL